MQETEIDGKKLWDSVLVEIELSVSRATFNTWFRNTYVVKEDAGIVYLSVPNAFVKDWLFNKYHKTILKHLRAFQENVRGVEYVVTKDEKRKPSEIHPRGEALQSGALPLGDYYVDRETNLNPRYTFDTFVVGPFNELAHAAAQAITKKPGGSYNPFFVYGNTGHGKTHLIQAVGHHIKTAFPGKKVYYVTSERFTIDYMNSLQAMRVNQFKEKYRNYDVLIMDDIQFFSDKDKSQEELFYLFNSLYAENKQIVFSSDKHPNFLPGLEERLKSRFAAGMIVDIPKPDQESRSSILRAKAQMLRFPLSEELCSGIADLVEGNIRELEGALNTVMCHAQLKARDLSFGEVKILLKNSEKPKRSLPIKDVVRTIANFYNIDEESIYEKTRRKEVVKPRQVAMYILREDCSVSYPLIGQKLGGRDHTTVIHSYEKIKTELKMDNTLESELRQIRALL